MKNNNLTTGLLGLIAGLFLFYVFTQYFEITLRDTKEKIDTTKITKEVSNKTKNSDKSSPDYMAEAKNSPHVISCRKTYKSLLTSEKEDFDMSACLLKKTIDINTTKKISNARNADNNKLLTDKCREANPDPKDINKFLECIDPPENYKPLELSDYHLSIVSDFEASNYETHKLEDYCENTQLVDNLSNIYLVQFSSGDIYRGQLNKKCQKNGEGVYIYKNGTEFIGTYSDGERVSGTEYYSDGGVRDGMRYINDQLHGSPKYYYANGQVNQETYRNGKLINNVIIQLSPQQVYANQQQVIENQRRNKAIGNYARCLGTPGEDFGSCANAWQGYTPPPPKKEYDTDCDIDLYYDQIRCKTRQK